MVSYRFLTNVITVLIPTYQFIGPTQPKYLSKLTLDSICQELEEIEQACLSIITYQCEEHKIGLIARLKDMYRAIVNKPLDTTFIKTISTVWHGLQAIQSGKAEMNLINRFQRKCIMITTYGAWFWLDGWIIEQCKKILSNTWDGGNNWLFKLIKKIEMFHSIRVTSRSFDPMEYGIDISSQVFTYTTPPIPWDQTPENEANCIISSAIQIIQFWLNYPTGKEAIEERKKAWFVYVIIQELGEDVLLLNQTWTAFIQTKKNMFETRDFKNPALFDCARPFREAAIRHPLHDQSSEEYQLMIRASRMLKAIREGGQRNIDPSTHEASIQSSIAPVDRVPDHARYISDDKFSKLFRYIRDMLELDCVGLSGLQNPLKLQVEVANNMDTMFPFRELAPGRIQSRSNEGPYSPEHCATRAGLFSALVWRGITFSTEFSMQEPMLFNSYSEWEDTLSKVRESGEEESYIYNISAYGVTNSNRGPQHATKYWTASKSHD